MAGEIKLKESLNQTQTQIFIGNMQDYSIPSVELSIMIARKWLSNIYFPKSSQFKELLSV